MTYQVLRMASGEVTAYALLNTDSYVIADWTRQADQTYVDWVAVMPEKGMTAPFVGGIELGSGIQYGNYSGVIEFVYLTENMQQYLVTNILNSKPVEVVTVYAYDDFTRALAVFVGELVSPHMANAESSYSPFGHKQFTNNQYVFRGGTKKSVSYLLLENGDNLLTETDALFALEEQD